MPQAAPVPQASPQKPPWDCQVSAPKSDQGYTVGEVFNLECHGEDSLTLKEPLTVVLDEKMHHSLHF